MLTDVGLPDALALAREASALFPSLRTLLMSGDAQDFLVRNARVPPDVRVLKKPFSAQELLAAVKVIFPSNGAARAVR